MIPTPRALGRTVIALVLAAGLLLSACGDDDGEATTTTTEASDETARGDTEPAGDAGGDGEVVEINLVDYTFEDLPESVPAGTRLTVTNSSEGELHELVALPLPEGEDRAIDELAQLPEEELETVFTAPPATVLLAEPGGEQMDAVGDGTLSEPGRYAIVCFIPAGVDPGEYLAAAEASGEGPPEVPDAGPPHFVQGMYGEITVT